MKPTGRRARNARLKAHRATTRQTAFLLDGGRCVWPTCRRWIGSLDYAHEHEVQWRSKGGDPTDVDIVVTLCALCHADIHPRLGGIKKRMSGTRATGFICEERQEDDTWQVVGSVSTSTDR